MRLAPPCSPESYVPCSNFYFKHFIPFNSHPEVISAAKDAVDKYEAGPSSVRFICGTQVRCLGDF